MIGPNQFKYYFIIKLKWLTYLESPKVIRILSILFPLLNLNTQKHISKRERNIRYKGKVPKEPSFSRIQLH